MRDFARCNLRRRIQTSKIILKAYKRREAVGEVVKISEEAQRVLSTIMRENNLTAKYIVSQMIIQGADFIELVEEEE